MITYFEFLKSVLANFSDQALVIRLSFIVIAACLLIILLCVILISLSRRNKWRRDQRESRLKPTFDRLIYQYISFTRRPLSTGEETTRQAIVSEIKRLTIRRKNRQLFLDRLIGYKKTLAGSMSELINELFDQAGLHSFCLKKLSKFADHKKIQGLSEFTELGIPLADVYIIPLTHSRSRSVRTTARCAYIKLSKNNPFTFFDSSIEELLLWEQIELFQIITTSEQGHVPNFSTWISYAENPGIIRLCLRLVAHFHQSDALPSVQRLLQSRDAGLRSAAIECLGKMKSVDHEDKLIEIYFEQPLHCRLAILSALGRIGSGRYVDFLVNEVKTGSEFAIRKAAAKALIRNLKSDPEEAHKVLSDLLKYASDEQKIMINYYRHPLLQPA